MIRTLLLALFGSFAAAQLAAQEAAATPAVQGPHFADIDGSHCLLWGDRVVLRDLRFQMKGQTVPFDLGMVSTSVNGESIQFSSGEGAAPELLLLGTFALDYQPEILQQTTKPGAPLQFAIGRIASELCDTLVAREAGLALVAPGCLDLDFWLEGGPAELRLKLRDQPTLELTQAPEVDEQGLARLQKALQEAAKARERPLQPEVEELLFRELPQGLKRRALAPGMIPQLDQPTIINLRVGARPDQAAFDVVMLYNPSPESKTMKINFQELGWDKPRKQRNIVLNDDGSSLGEVSLECEIAVAARGGITMLTARSLMPRGVIATSDGPLAPVFRPWKWKSLTSAPSGVVSFISTWECAKPTPEAGWVICAVADGRNAAFKIFSPTDEQGRELVFVQRGSIARVQTLESDAERRQVILEFKGRVED